MNPASHWPDLQQHDTYPKLLAHNARHWPDDVALREKEFGIWNEVTWRDYEAAVELFTLGLLELGVQPGDIVGIVGDNRPEWVQCEIAVHAAGAMSLGIYQDSMGEEVQYLLQYGQVQVVMCEDEEQVDKILQIADDCPDVRHIIYHDPRGMRKYPDPRLISQHALFEQARAVRQREPERYRRLVESGPGERPSMLITTSGTTSRPKLVMFQSRSFLDHTAAYLRADPKYAGDNYVSVLPLPWIMEQVYALAQSLITRMTVNFVEESETMMQDLREIGPNFVLLAPRVWESIAADVKARMMEASRIKQWMYALGMKIGMPHLERHGRPSRLAHVLLFRALRDRLGFSHLHSAATGGAALGPDTFKFFLAMGVPLRQIYGQTEMAGVYTGHQPDDLDFDSVGVPFDNTRLRIDQPDDNGVGEVLVRSSGMFLGYYKNEQATVETVRDGWLHTGDAGYMKENGHLVVIDRLSDLAVTSLGHRFSPMYVENKLKFSPFIAEAVILGHERPWLSAMICIRYGILSKWAEHRGIAFTNYTNLSAQPQVYDMIRREIEQVNAGLPAWQQVRKFLLLYKELDPDDGELTRTRKIRRKVVQEKYADIIDAIYDGRESVHVDTVITFQDGTRSQVITDLRVVDLS
ncbi:long-chain fatty acid--CoA ligase [Castellaniella sp.]|uniref:long-chain fatty acid--CoA ligase n=1 Tax=Castellaniella sp. TaxID=1955812 RepID=UPI00355E2B70